MKAHKTIIKTGILIHKLFSKMFNAILDVLLSSFNAARMIEIYCNERFR